MFTAIKPTAHRPADPANPVIPVSLAAPANPANSAPSPAQDAFTLRDYVSLFAYDGPRRPGILDHELVTVGA